MNIVTKIFTVLAMLILLTMPASAELSLDNAGGNSGTMIDDSDSLLSPDVTIEVANGDIPGIESISLQKLYGNILYDYIIIVQGACPEGASSNNLAFYDQSGDVYRLKIISKTVKNHYLRYHSNDGNIEKMKWQIK